MASQNKDQNQDQNAIENLNSHLTAAGERMAANKKIVYWTVGIIAVIAVFVLSYLFIYRNPRLQNSWDAYNEVQLKELKGELNDTTAAAAYQKVADQYAGTDAASCAALAAAETFYDLGQYDNAIKYLTKGSIAEPVLATQATMLLGDCYVNKGPANYDKAIETFRKAIKKADGNPQIVPVALLKLANIYDAQKKYQDALDCYQQIQTGYPQFTIGQLPVTAYIEREKARLGK